MFVLHLDRSSFLCGDHKRVAPVVHVRDVVRKLSTQNKNSTHARSRSRLVSLSSSQPTLLPIRPPLSPATIRHSLYFMPSLLQRRDRVTRGENAFASLLSSLLASLCFTTPLTVFGLGLAFARGRRRPRDEALLWRRLRRWLLDRRPPPAS